MKHAATRAIVLIILSLLSTPQLQAASTPLSWSAPPERMDGMPITDPLNYKVYYGLSSGIYTNVETAGNVLTYTVNGLTDGIPYYFAVKAVDQTGNESYFSNEVLLTASDQGLTGSITINNGNSDTNTLSVSLGLTASSGVTQMQFSNDNVSWSMAETYSTSKTWNLSSGDGAKTVFARFRDSSGNWSIAYSDTINVDTVSPNTTISSQPSNPSNSSSASFSFTSTEVNSTFQCQMDTAGYTSCTSPMSYTNLTDGNHTFSVRALDAAGNVDSSPATYSWITNTASQAMSANLSWSAPLQNEDGSPIISPLTYKVYYGQTSGNYTNNQSAGSSLNYTVTGLTSGVTYYFTVTAVNSTGIESSFTNEVQFGGTVAPTGTITINGGAANANSVTVSLALTASAGVTQMQFSNDNTSWSAYETFATTKSWMLTSSNGAKTVYARFMNSAGSTSPVYSDTINLDTVSPDTTISSQPSNPTNSTSASFSFSSTESGSTFQCRMDSGSYAACTNPRSYTGLTSGSHTFYVRATDAAGNTDSTPASRTWTIDTSSPTGSVNINSGAAYANAINVSLSLTCTDTNGCSQMQFSNDNVSWSTAETFSTGKSWNLSSGDGAKTVFARFRDSSGNWSSSYSDGVTLDTVFPDTMITFSPSITMNSSSISFSFTSTEAGSTFQCRLDAEGYTSCTSPKSYINLSEGDHSFSVRAIDASGNADQSPATYSWTIDVTAPSFISTSPAPNSSINTASAGYSLSETVQSGNITYTRTGGSNDPSSPHVYNFTSTNLTAGTHSISTGLNLSNGALYSVKFEASDAAGNNTSVTNTNVGFDATGASVIISTPSTNSIVNHSRVSYNLSESISSGRILFTWTGGLADYYAPHAYDMLPTELTAGVHQDVETNTILVDGAIYTVTIDNIVDLAGNPSSPMSNINVKFDSTVVVISNTSPSSNSIIANAVVKYTLSEDASAGKVTFAWTGGNTDITSPHVYNLNASDIISGQHTVNTNKTLVNGAFYTVSFEAADLAGNPSTSISNGSIYFSGTQNSLSVNRIGNGLISSSVEGINCGVDCSEAYETGTQITLTASPDAGYVFNGWTGDCTGSENTCMVTMDMSRNVGASFTRQLQYEETESAISYTGIWSVYSCGGCSNGSIMQSSQISASAVFTFDGTGVSYMAPKSANQGMVDIYIDGSYQTSVDLYSKTFKGQQLVFQTSGLTSGIHTISIQVAGQRNRRSKSNAVSIDKFVLIP